jgi:hypothetical protein
MKDQLLYLHRKFANKVTFLLDNKLYATAKLQVVILILK